MFIDRTEAGQRLGDELNQRRINADIVLAVPRGGLPLGRAVADALNLPLDIVVARKMGAPHNPELAIGAVSADGTVWLNDQLINDLSITDDYLEDIRTQEAANAQQKANRYRKDRDPPDLDNKRVIIVDDGVATGATTIACIRQVRDSGAAHVILAIPVGSPRTIDRLETEADTVICLETPVSFQAVGQFYDSFSQVSDEEAIQYLSE